MPLDLDSAHRTLKSASVGYSTSENKIGFLRGVQFKYKRNDWNWQPRRAAKNTLSARDTSGKFVKVK
jgi:hypothetical protein